MRNFAYQTSEHPSKAEDRTALLKIEGLSIDFNTEDGPKRVVDDLSFELYAGETLALVGESGSGKTATSLSILDLLPESAVRSGSIRFGGKELVGCSPAEMRQVRGSEIAMVFQEPMVALNPLYTAERLLSQAMRSHGGRIGNKDVRARSIELLKKVRMPRPEEKLGRYPHELSGGQRQRLMIAMALCRSPRVLIADEPTTALDPTVQIEILALLDSLKRELGMAMLLITHDLGVVAGLADNVVVMESGRGIETVAVRDIFAAPSQDFTKSLLDSIPRLEIREERRHVPAETGRHDGPQEVLTVQDLCVRFGRPPRSMDVIHDLSLSIRAGEVLGIVGESGSGKSTLARTIVGLVKARSGNISVAGHSATSGRAELARARSRTGLIFQDPASSLNPRRSIGYSVVEPVLRRGAIGTPKPWRKLAGELLETVHLPKAWITRYPHELSGGQRQRIAIARALSFSPELVLADEPTAALDVSIQDKVITLLMELQAARGFAMLFISHDLPLVSALADHVAVMREGIIVEQGSTRQVLSAPSDNYTTTLLDSVLEPDPDLARERILRISSKI